MCTQQDHVGPRTIWSKRVENSNSICLEDSRDFGLVSAILAIIMWRTQEQPLRNPSRVSVTQSSRWNEAGIKGNGRTWDGAEDASLVKFSLY